MGFYKHRLCLRFPPTADAPPWYPDSEFVWKSEHHIPPQYMFGAGGRTYIHTSPILDFIDDDGVLYTFKGDFVDGFPIWRRQAEQQWILRYSLYLDAWLIHNPALSFPYKPVQSGATDYGWFQSHSYSNNGILFTPKGTYAEDYEGTTIHLSPYGKYVGINYLSFTNPLDSTDTRRFGYQRVYCSAITNHNMYLSIPIDSDNVLQIKDTDLGQVLCSFKAFSSGYVATIDGVQWYGSALPPHDFTSGTVRYQRQNEQGSVETITFTSKGVQEEDLCVGAERRACYYGDVALWI